MHALGRRGRWSAALLATAIFSTPGGTAGAQVAVNPDVAALAQLPLVDSSSLRNVVGALAGKSGKLLARFVAPPRSIRIPVVVENLNYTSKVVPQIHEVAGASALGNFSLITMRSFGDKIGGSVGAYRLGFWPDERGGARSEEYSVPEGFIEVTPENQDTRISEHFRLRDFLTKNQHDVWPKYLVLQESLIDKLELVIQDLKDHGVPVRKVGILSGFRTPQYNLALGDRSGRARDSRHTYGDAADIFIDNNGDGRMDDLNGDGRVNMADTRVILAAIERVEKKYPELVGGTGLYHTNGSHGAFAHVDVRGSRARWVNSARATRTKKSRATSKPKGKKIASSSPARSRAD